MGDLWGRRPPLIADRETHARMRFVRKNTRRRRPPVKRDRGPPYRDQIFRIRDRFEVFIRHFFNRMRRSHDHLVRWPDFTSYCIAHRCSWSRCHCLCTAILAKSIDV